MNPRRRWPLVLGVLLLAGVVAVGALGLWYQRNVDPPGKAGAEVEITVAPGMSTGEIGALLEEKGVISSAQVFRYFVKFNGLGTVEAGDYTLHQKEAMATVVKTLEAGAKIDKGIPLTIPEGLTVPEVAKIVGTLPGRSEARFLQVVAGGTIRSRYQAPGVTSLEGLLLPETYFLDPEKDDETAILRRMVESFDALATRLDINAAAARLGVTPYEAVVVASMVEREARVDEDRGKVARVIYNRLAADMPMQIDATIQFALGKQKDIVLFSDLEIDSPYNTYKVAGLPPGPIASPGPGVAGGRAQPTPGTWIFFVVVDESGHHAFSDTLEEQDRNERPGRAERRPLSPGPEGWEPGRQTSLAALIGSPVRHSRSPAIHNAAFRALGLDWVYLAFEVAPGRVPEALAGMRALGIRGLSVTIPHKEDTAAAVDELSATAAALGAANTVVVGPDGRLRGENTDAAGFLAALADAGVEVDGRRCLVRGAGGAARAVVWALASAGAKEVVVVPGRDRGRAEATAAVAAAGVGRVGTGDEVAGAAIVVNATPLGLDGGTALAVDPALLGPGQVVVDLIPRASTALLEAAAARGATAVDGLGMLVHQGALAFRLWTGCDPPLGVMRAAARS